CRVTRATGDWTVVSANPSFQSAVDLVVLDDGNLAVIDGVAQSLFLVDPETGEVAVAVDDFQGGNYLIRSVSSGAPPAEPALVSFGMEGNELVLTIPGIVGSIYQLQSSSSSAFTWANEGDAITGEGSL